MRAWLKTSMKRRVAAGLLGVGAWLTAGVAQADIVTLTPIGDPTWKPVDFHLFTAPIGSASDGFSGFLETAQAILPPPHHVLVNGSIEPGTPHPGPYDTEMGEGIANAGFAEKTTFTVSDFSGGNGVWLTWMIVPDDGAPTGSSPDFDSGPIIPNGIFPLTYSETTLRNGQVFDGGGYAVDALDGVDGRSHFPNFAVDALEFTSLSPADAPGAYEYQSKFTDANGDGWLFNAPFTVVADGGGGIVPEPASALLLAPAAGALLLRRRTPARPPRLDA